MPITEAMASRRAGRRVRAPSMDEACGDAAVRADPESPEAFAAAIRDALGRRDELRAKGLAHARGFSWGKTGEIPRGVPPILVGLDTTPPLQTRAGTARSSAALLRAARRISGRRSRQPRVGCAVAARCSVVPAALARATEWTFCTAPHTAGPFGRAMPTVIPVHDLAVLRQPECVQPVDPRVRAARVVPSRPRAALLSVIAVSEFTERELHRDARRSREEDPGRPERRRR